MPEKTCLYAATIAALLARPVPDGGLCTEEEQPGEGGEGGAGDGGSGDLEKRLKGLEAAAAAERKRAQAAEDALKKLKDASEAAEKKKAEEQGEYQRLYEAEKTERAKELAELEALRSAKTEREAALGARNKERLEALPEEARALVPETLTGDALASHLDKIAAFAADPSRPSGTFKPKKKSTATIPPECHADARRAGLKGGATESFFGKWRTWPAGKRWAASQQQT